MMELTMFHREIIEIYGYYVQVRAAITGYNRFLRDLVAGPAPQPTPTSSSSGQATPIIQTQDTGTERR